MSTNTRTNEYEDLKSYDDLESIVGSLCYLEKEAERARLFSVKGILSEAIKKIRLHTNAKDIDTQSIYYDEFLKEKLSILSSFIKLTNNLKPNDINTLLLAITEIEDKPH